MKRKNPHGFETRDKHCNVHKGISYESRRDVYYLYCHVYLGGLYSCTWFYSY